jgi:hypothetical protein
MSRARGEAQGRRASRARAFAPRATVVVALATLALARGEGATLASTPTAPAGDDGAPRVEVEREGERPPEPIASAADAFDRAAAVAELRRMATLAARCGRGGRREPTEAIVFVTFAEDGLVASVDVDAAVAPPAAACLRALVRDARVPPFRGPVRPLRQRVVLR